MASGNVDGALVLDADRMDIAVGESDDEVIYMGEEDTDLGSVTYARRMENLLADHQSADVTFIVGIEKARISAHICMMSNASSFFQQMFVGGLNRGTTVTVPNADVAGFRAVLRYIYTGEANLTNANAFNVIYLAQKYMMKRLYSHCVAYIHAMITPRTVCDFIPKIGLYEELQKACWELIDKHASEFVQSPSFLGLGKPFVDEILRRDSLTAPEILLYNRIVDWAKAELESQNLPIVTAQIGRVLTDLLPLIRFPLMTQEEFANGPAISGTLSQQDVVELFLWFSTKSTPTRFITRPRAYSQRSLIRVVHCKMQIHYLVKPTGTMGKARRVLASKIDVPADRILLLYRGERVKDEDTAMKLGLKDGDIIEALSRPPVL